MLTALPMCVLAASPAPPQDIHFAPQPYPLQPVGTALGSIDWDQDGDLDLFGAGLAWFANDGHARFTEVARAGLALTHFSFGDVRGGPEPEALARDSRNSYWIVQEARDALGTLPGPFGACSDLRLADLDRDGRLDAVAQGAAGLVWSRNLGAGLFSAPIALAPGIANLGSHFALADLDRDGDTDLFLLEKRRGLRLLFNDGAGGFADTLSLRSNLVQSGNDLVACADVDGNGFDDLLYSDARDSRCEAVFLYLNQGARQFVAAHDRLPAVRCPRLLTVFDRDDDGDLDLMTGNHWLVNDGSGNFLRLESPPLSFAPQPGDYDGDGDTDIAAGAQLLLGDGNGAFLSLGQEPEIFGVPADIDGDADADVLGVVNAFENDGTGTLTARADSLPVRCDDPVLGDLDGDGDLDLVPDGGASALENDGTGNFSDLAACGSITTHWLGESALGDLDGDGDLDLYQVRYWLMPCHDLCPQPAPDALRLNDGSGCLIEDASRLASVADVGQHVELGDLDRDGDLDVVTDAVRVLRNDAGQLVDIFPFASLPLSSPTDLALADLDLDGDLDLYFTRERRDFLFVLRDAFLPNDGLGYFPSLQYVQNSNTSIRVADLEGDGDPDLIGTHLRSPTDYQQALTVVRNDGASWTHLPQPELFIRGLQLADLDRDGDLDLLDGFRVLVNEHHSLAVAGPARLSHPFEVELRGAPGTGCLLLASTALAPSATSFGLRQLDPAHRVYGKDGFLDANGRLVRSFPVPNEAALVGLTLHWQALIQAPLRWSNRASTTITDF